MKVCLAIILFVFVSLELFAQVSVVKYRGDVTVIDQNNVETKIDESVKIIDAGKIVATKSSSFILLKTSDNGQISVGPNSQTRIGDFKKDGINVIELLKGAVRAQVQKDQKSSGKIKSMVTTKTAAIGVRGTEFLVKFTENIANTSVVTFSGEVQMVKSVQTEALSALIQRFDTTDAVAIPQGFSSSIIPAMVRPTEPIKMDPVQFEKLLNNSDFILEDKTLTSTDIKSQNLESGIEKAQDHKIVKQDREQDQQQTSKPYEFKRTGNILFKYSHIDRDISLDDFNEIYQSNFQQNYHLRLDQLELRVEIPFISFLGLELFGRFQDGSLEDEGCQSSDFFTCSDFLSNNLTDFDTVFNRDLKPELGGALHLYLWRFDLFAGAIAGNDFIMTGDQQSSELMIIRPVWFYGGVKFDIWRGSFLELKLAASIQNYHDYSNDGVVIKDANLGTFGAEALLKFSDHVALFLSANGVNHNFSGEYENQKSDGGKFSLGVRLE